MAPPRDHDYFMGLALNQARIAFAQGDAPIGAIVVKEDAVIGRGRNQREEKNDPAGHAEILALRDAAAELGDWRLAGCSLYCTLEPCIMCAGAIVQSHIQHLYYGASDPKAGGVESLYHLLEDARLNHRVLVHPGLRQAECEALLAAFFARLR
ncbi:MAG: tRNA adenosine(34) deaminase TadA [bacterium]|nr:tRNA adenosine(34) deaminase TadA [bacterium]